MLERSGEEGTFLHHWWECELVQPLQRAAWLFVKKLRRELSYDPAISLLGEFSGENYTLNRYMHPSDHCSTIY